MYVSSGVAVLDHLVVVLGRGWKMYVLIDTWGEIDRRVGTGSTIQKKWEEEAGSLDSRYCSPD